VLFNFNSFHGHEKGNLKNLDEEATAVSGELCRIDVKLKMLEISTVHVAAAVNSDYQARLSS
jgi:hypothetical protein